MGKTNPTLGFLKVWARALAYARVESARHVAWGRTRGREAVSPQKPSDYTQTL